MTKEQFWEALRAFKGKFVVYPKDNDEPFYIRHAETGDCPVCAVAKTVSDSPTIKSTNAIVAADEIDLPFSFAITVVEASDGIYDLRGAAETRKKLVEILGLQEYSSED